MRLQTVDRFNATDVLAEIEFGADENSANVLANLRAACERIIHLEMLVDDMTDAMEDVA